MIVPTTPRSLLQRPDPPPPRRWWRRSAPAGGASGPAASGTRTTRRRPRWATTTRRRSTWTRPWPTARRPCPCEPPSRVWPPPPSTAWRSWTAPTPTSTRRGSRGAGRASGRGGSALFYYFGTCSPLISLSLTFLRWELVDFSDPWGRTLQVSVRRQLADIWIKCLI